MSKPMVTAAPANPPPQGIDVSDAAWARIPTPFSPDELAKNIADAEVLLRLNPYYYFKSCRKTGPDSYHAEFENQSNQRQVVVDIDVESGPGNGISLNYRQGIKRRTIFSIEPGKDGSVLVLTDDYGSRASGEASHESAPEIDKSQLAWAESIRIYLSRLKRFSGIPGWRWYIRRLWIPMKPSARRIVWLLYLITLVEFAFFCFVVLIWWAEQHK